MARPTLQKATRTRTKKTTKPEPPKKLLWLDAFDRRLALRGLAWMDENRAAKQFRRFPDRAEKYASKAVKELSHCTAGVFLSFFTDSAEISVRMKVANHTPMTHMPSTGMVGAELFFKENNAWHPATTARPAASDTSFEGQLFHSALPKLCEYRLYFPLYKKLEEISLGFVRGSKIEPAPAPKDTKPIFFYGTSITQGGCANTTGSDYVSTLGRALNTEVINFGFSGSGRGEPGMARLIRQIDAEIFVLDFLTNAPEATLDEVLPEFIRLLREKRRETPIVIISGPAFNQILWDPARRAIIDRKRDTAMRTYLKRKDAGDKNIHFIDGSALLPAGLTGTYVDGVHPTSHGFAIMAERLEPQLRALRLRQEYDNSSASKRKAR